MNTENLTRIAVYGTLKQGKENHRLLKDSQYIGDGITAPVFDMVSFGGFPGIIKGEYPVLVEVYDVSPEQLRPIDYLEGHPDFYKRDIYEVYFEDGTVSKCYIYNLVERSAHYATNRKVIPNSKGQLVW